MGCGWILMGAIVFYFIIVSVYAWIGGLGLFAFLLLWFLLTALDGR